MKTSWSGTGIIASGGTAREPSRRSGKVELEFRSFPEETLPEYLVIDGAWLEDAIRSAETLREHAQSTGRAVAIAATSVRLESLREVRRLAVAALPPGEGGIELSIERAPGR